MQGKEVEKAEWRSLAGEVIPLSQGEGFIDG